MFSPGDVLAFSSFSALGCAINVCTLGLPFYGASHVGIVAEHPRTKKPILFESTALTDYPCLLRGVKVDGVQAQNIRHRLLTECRFTKVYQYKLKVPLSKYQNSILTNYLVGMLGRDYDYIGALRARETPISHIEQTFFKENLRSLFCSELVAACLRKLNKLTAMNVSNWNPNRLCRALSDICEPPVRVH